MSQHLKISKGGHHIYGQKQNNHIILVLYAVKHLAESNAHLGSNDTQSYQQRDSPLLCKEYSKKHLRLAAYLMVRNSKLPHQGQVQSKGAYLHLSTFQGFGN